MKCSKVQEWISLEMDEQLPPEHVSELREHLEVCTECHAFRDDLQIGLRMLHATDPVLPDNFDWKLQLRLSQTLRETARDTAFPWRNEESGWRRWFARASLSAAVGLAAVLAVAFLAPNQFAANSGRGGETAISLEPLRLPVQTGSSNDQFYDPSRLPLSSSRTTYTSLGSGAGVQRQVSSGAQRSYFLGSTSDADLMRLRQLEQQNEIMRRRMQFQERTIAELQAKLDSLTGQIVDKH